MVIWGWCCGVIDKGASLHASIPRFPVHILAVSLLVQLFADFWVKQQKMTQVLGVPATCVVDPQKASGS